MIFTRLVGKLVLSMTVFTACFFVFLSLPEGTLAADPSMSLYPSTGYALLNEDFAVDVMLDTGGQDTSTARAVFRFDPSKIRVTKAQHGDLYCQYPQDEALVDNTNGWVKITGFCNDPYYNSGGSAGLFGRVTFKPLVEGEITLGFEDNYSDAEWNSKLVNDGSPPQEIGSVTYSDGHYTVVSQISSGSTTTGTTGSTKLPGAGVLDDVPIWAGVVLIFMAGAVLIFDRTFSVVRRKHEERHQRTVIV